MRVVFLRKMNLFDTFINIFIEFAWHEHKMKNKLIKSNFIYIVIIEKIVQNESIALMSNISRNNIEHKIWRKTSKE